MDAEVIRDDNCLRLRNDQVELLIDPRNGQALEIWNRRLDWNFKASPGGAWPISYWIRHPIYPWWGGRPRQNEMSAEDHTPPPEIHVARGREGVTLKLLYAEIGVVRRLGMNKYPGVLDGAAEPSIMGDREPAGISAKVEIHLPHRSDFFLLRAEVDLHGSKCDIVRFGSGWGGALRADSEREHEHIAAPEWHGGAVYDDPHRLITHKDCVGRNMIWPYIAGSPNSLHSGWVDFYGRRGGLGIGYLGKSGQIVAFEAEADDEGLSLNWRTFDLSGVDTYFGDHAHGFEGLYPLEAGKSYATDWWIVAPHEGDWHRMADIYRRQYQKTFPGEYLTWETLSDAAKECDYIISANFDYSTEGCHFDGLPAAVGQTLDTLDIEPERALVWVIGTQTEGFDTTFPDFFPMHDVCGGDEAARRALEQLETIGLAGAFIYTNPSYNHPCARLFVPQADTGVRANHGDFACFASPAWKDMWLAELAPALLDVGACGIQLDQWPLLFCPCRRKKHGHQTDSMSALRGQVLGKRTWLKALREHLTKGRQRWFFFSEAGTDYVGGLVDIWSFGQKCSYDGGRPMDEIARFTHPQYVMTTGQSLLDALINGFVIIPSGVGKPGKDKARAAGMAARSDFQQYRRVRAELRSAAAPGFPYGFRDTLGLEVDSPEVSARSYRDERGITVIYYARDDVCARVEVIPELLGHPGNPPEMIDVSLKAGQAAWWSKTFGTGEKSNSV